MYLFAMRALLEHGARLPEVDVQFRCIKGLYCQDRAKYSNLVMLAAKRTRLIVRHVIICLALNNRP